MFYQAYRLILDRGDGWDRFLQDISEAGIESAEKQTAREVRMSAEVDGIVDETLVDSNRSGE